MNIFALSGIFIGISSLSMAVLMLLIGKERLHHIWALFCTSVAVWGFGGYVVAITKDVAQADLWWRLAHVGIILIPVLFLHFIYEFLQLKNRVFVLSIYALGFFFLAVNLFGDLFIADMRWVFNQFYYDSPPGILYIPFTFFFFALIVFSHFLLWQAYEHASKFTKTQISYFFLATAVGFTGGGLSFLPVYGIDLYPVFNIAIVLSPLIITYAIIKKQLFDVRVVLTQLLVGAIATLLFINFFTSETLFEYSWKGVIFGAFMVAGYLLIKSVINEIKQREQLQQLNIQLKKLDASKSEFVSIASHQLRTPLTAIKGYISMLMEGSYGELGAKQQKPMENVYNSNERLIRLVNDLLNISRIESGKIVMEWQKANMEEVIQGVVEELQIKSKEKRLKIIFEKPEPSLPFFNMDPGKIRNVLLNLLDNAIKYTSKGSITIALHAKPENKPQNMTSALITVKDTGQGMDANEISHLFESFSRGSAGNTMWTEGSGLGLYIAKQFVLMHKGKIWAESDGKGRGSTFFVELPVQ